MLYYIYVTLLTIHDLWSWTYLTSSSCSIFSVCGNISISCSFNSTAHQVYNLFRNGHKVHEVNIENKSQFENIFSSGEVSKFIHSLDQYSYFQISQLNHNSSGVYVCKGCTIFPPPINCKESSIAVVSIGMFTSTYNQFHTHIHMLTEMTLD